MHRVAQYGRIAPRNGEGDGDGGEGQFQRGGEQVRRERVHLERLLQTVHCHRVLRYLRGEHVDGVLLISAHSGDPLLADLARGGARQMTRYPVGQGRRQIGMIHCPQVVGCQERLQGYRDMVDVLLRLIRREPVSSRVLPTELVIRGFA
jgi:hypothetical protein